MRRTPLLQHDPKPDREPSAYMLDVTQYLRTPSLVRLLIKLFPALGELLAVAIVSSAVAHVHPASTAIMHRLVKKWNHFADWGL